MDAIARRIEARTDKNDPTSAAIFLNEGGGWSQRNEVWQHAAVRVVNDGRFDGIRITPKTR